MPTTSLCSRPPLAAHLTVRGGIVLIQFDLGKLGKARFHRPTGLEIVALILVLLFVVFLVGRR